MEPKQILVVDDEVYMVELLAMSMRNYGYRCLAAYSGEEALELAVRHRPAIILLDLMLPGIDGIETCRRLKENPETSAIPVIMLTAKSEEADKVMGLGMGADDYVTKPFGLGELFARIGVALRRLEPAPAPAPAAAQPEGGLLAVGDIQVDQEARQVLVDGMPVHLTLSEYRLLLMMAQRPGCVVEREAMCRQLSGEGRPCGGRTVDVHIRNLRRKLFDEGESSHFIETVRGVGYRM